VSFQHRYTKLALDREEHLRQLLGEDFEPYFKRTVSLKVKKDVAEDPERLDAMVSCPGRGAGRGQLRLAVRGRAVAGADQGVHRDQLPIPGRDARPTSPQPSELATSRRSGNLKKTRNPFPFYGV
jgi:hypothetical protein